MVRKLIQAFAVVAHGVLTVHGWYRAILPAKRIPPKMTKSKPEELSLKSSVVIMAASRVEAEEIAELLGKDCIVVGYIQKTRYDLLRDES
jgi:hypothetical protein